MELHQSFRPKGRSCLSTTSWPAAGFHASSFSNSIACLLLSGRLGPFSRLLRIFFFKNDSVQSRHLVVSGNGSRLHCLASNQPEYIFTREKEHSTKRLFLCLFMRGLVLGCKNDRWRVYRLADRQSSYPIGNYIEENDKRKTGATNGVYYYVCSLLDSLNAIFSFFFLSSSFRVIKQKSPRRMVRGERAIVYRRGSLFGSLRRSC